MSKPWGKTYAVHPEDSRCILSTSGADEGKVVADLRVHVSEARETGEMFAAAPDMARALRDVLPVLREMGGKPSRERTECRHDGQCRFERAGAAWDAIEAALRKAGALP